MRAPTEPLPLLWTKIAGKIAGNLSGSSKTLALLNHTCFFHAFGEIAGEEPVGEGKEEVNSPPTRGF